MDGVGRRQMPAFAQSLAVRNRVEREWSWWSRDSAMGWMLSR
jgi:hypothetical protein